MCRRCQGAGVQSHRGRGRYSPYESHAPARRPPMVVQPMPRSSIFRDAAAVAGGVAVGSTVGNLASNAITGLFGGGHRQREVIETLPRDYHVGSEPSGPCAFEISQFLQCATNNELTECNAFATALKECKRRYKLD